MRANNILFFILVTASIFAFQLYRNELTNIVTAIGYALTIGFVLTMIRVFFGKFLTRKLKTLLRKR